MGSVNPVRGQEEPLCVDIGFYDTGYPSITLRDEHGDRCLTVDYRGYVPNMHIAVPMGCTRDIEVLCDKGVILSRKPVKTVLRDGEPIGMFPLTHRYVLEVFNAAEEHYSAVSYVDVDVVSLQDSLVRDPFRVRYQSTDRNILDTGALNPENNSGSGTRSILEYALEKAKDRWGNNSEVGILIAQDGDGTSRMKYTSLARFAQKRLHTLIVDELTTRHGVEIKGQYFFEDEWDTLKRMIQDKKVPHIRLGDEVWEIKYYEFPLEYQSFGYNDWYYRYDYLGLHQVESPSENQSHSDTEELKFRLLPKKTRMLPEISQNHAGCETNNEFTLPNQHEYSEGILEYAIQCGRKVEFPHNSTRIVVEERFRSTNSINTNVINKIEELEEAHGFTAPSAGCKHAPLKNLRALINSNNQGSIELPSGKWVLTLGKETRPERRVKNGEIQGIHKEYQFLELAPHKDNK